MASKPNIQKTLALVERMSPAVGSDLTWDVSVFEGWQNRPSDCLSYLLSAMF
jgi:hypothetical protein